MADQEEHYFTYAIYPHAEKWQEAKTVEQAYDLNQPAIAVAGGKPGSLLSKASVDRSNVVLETIKCAESGHGIIIRMYESENALTKTNLVVEGELQQSVCLQSARGGRSRIRVERRSGLCTTETV